MYCPCTWINIYKKIITIINFAKSYDWYSMQSTMLDQQFGKRDVFLRMLFISITYEIVALFLHRHDEDRFEQFESSNYQMRLRF